jgi:hypothetical protein
MKKDPNRVLFFAQSFGSRLTPSATVAAWRVIAVDGAQVLRLEVIRREPAAVSQSGRISRAGFFRLRVEFRVMPEEALLVERNAAL